MDDGTVEVRPRTDCYHLFVQIHNCEGISIADFDSLEYAKAKIEEIAKNLVKVDDEHNCSDDVFNSSSVCHFEVYVGDLKRIDEDGDEEPVFNMIYHSDYYYYNERAF